MVQQSHFPPLSPPGKILLPGAGAQSSHALRWGSALLLCLVLAGWSVTLLDMLRLHPNQYLYFNRAICEGMATAARRYDIDYWAKVIGRRLNGRWITRPAHQGGRKLR